MKLNELKGVPPDVRRATGQRSLVDYLEKQGFTQIGAGYNATVLTFEGKDKVLKVFHQDRAYRRWVDFCRSHPNNPFLPKVSKPVMLDKFKKSLFLVVIEKLEEPQRNRNESQFRCIIGDAAYRWEKSKEPSEKAMMVQLGEMTFEDYRHMFNELLANPHLLQIVEFLGQYPHELDINENNVMWRGSQIVITDPLV